MGKRGPKKGHGGRPRKKRGTNVAGATKYRRITVGPKSRGKQVLEHRHKAGLKKTHNRGTKKIVHHKNGVKTDNSRSNLRVTTRSHHTATHNRKRH